ncbi:unnamed protein product [Caenorhabditis bovis]|uniref:Uncharacterized protein n=1 Tax=Caenorhabditis bovis TaxID=2654633 RepID=A0A8S1EYW4_9PELO|nr:unnamed protein product [Caenorhabditis bovis]
MFKSVARCFAVFVAMQFAKFIFLVLISSCAAIRCFKGVRVKDNRGPYGLLREHCPRNMTQCMKAVLYDFPVTFAYACADPAVFTNSPDGCIRQGMQEICLCSEWDYCNIIDR